MPGRQPGRLHLALPIVIAIAAMGAFALARTGVGEAAGNAGADAPNVVVVMTDDQSLHSFTRRIMPRTFEIVVDQGTNFGHAVVSPPICCPSRAGFLTGQYPHNHGVFANNPGYPNLRDPEQVLPAWLDAAGYETGFVGKYLNHAVEALGGEPAPGWDRFFVLEQLRYYGVAAYDNGDRVELGDDTYTPAALNDQAVNFVEASPTDRPFFLWLATTSPHYRHDDTATCPGNMPKASRADHRSVRDLELPRSPSFNERDVSDKPPTMRKPPLSPADIRKVKRGYRCTAASLQEVDRGLARIWAAIEERGDAADTILVFTSDNGLFFGEHRLAASKGLPYEEALRVPLAIKLPSAESAGQVPTVEQPVSNQDLTATLLDLTGVDPCIPAGGCRQIDGLSAGGLLTGASGTWPTERGILVEQGTRGCKYAGIRTPDAMFTQLLRRGPGGECVKVGRELYDLRSDPYELTNIAGASPAGRELRSRLESLQSCQGRAGPNPCE